MPRTCGAICCETTRATCYNSAARTAQRGVAIRHQLRQLTSRSSFSPMMFAVAHRRPSSPRVAHRLALLALIALVMGAALVLATGGRASAQSKNAEVDGTAALKWSPANVTVPVGGTVTFKSSDGASCKVTFAKAGTFPFFCQVHFASGMIGTITVGKGGGGTATTTQTTGAPTVSAPAAASGTTPAKPGVYWLGYVLLGGGALLALAAVFAYLRFYPGFRRQR